MRIRIDVDLEIPERVKRAVRIVVPLLVILGGSAAFAAVPTTFKEGDTLSAQAMNDNFASLDKRVGDVESRISAKATAGYKLGGAYCGTTAAKTKGDLSGLGGAGAGYAKTRAPCQAACAGSPSAHMCTADELVRGAVLGVTTPSGWYATGVSREYANVEGYECFGWTSSEANRIGPVWSDSGAPSSQVCSTESFVLCCD